jgi:hypothetical protein
MPRIIVHAGHQNIGNITADKIGQASADTLRGGTGANGEMAWNSATADALTALLAAAGVDAVRTDAIWHAAVYGPDADLIVAIHYDGIGGTGRVQYCMAATVHSGPSTAEADARADGVIADWYALYPAQMGIAGNGPITDGMTQYYGGWYRTANTPMLLIEHCIGADGGGIRADRPTSEAAAAADFAVLAKHFNLGPPAPPPPAPDTFFVDGNPHGQIPMKVPFWNRWHYMDTLGLALPMVGYPVAAEVTVGGRRMQECERGWLGTQEAPDPWNVVMLLRDEWPT